MLDNPIVTKTPDHMALWVYMLLKATHGNVEKIFKGEKIVLEPGQFIDGRKHISDQTGITENKVRTIINDFKKDQQIHQLSSNKNSLFTVLNWNNYQITHQPEHQHPTNNPPAEHQPDTNEEPAEHQPDTNEEPAEHQQPTTNKNVKNKKNDIKDISSPVGEESAPEQKDSTQLINELFESVWKLYPHKRGKSAVSLSKKKALYKIGYEKMKLAVERYVEYVEITNENAEAEGGKPWLKYQDGSRFFGGTYMDYLADDYEPPKRVEKRQPVQKSSADRFNNFEGREHDYDKLERQLQGL